MSTKQAALLTPTQYATRIGRSRSHVYGLIAAKTVTVRVVNGKTLIETDIPPVTVTSTLLSVAKAGTVLGLPKTAVRSLIEAGALREVMVQGKPCVIGADVQALRVA
jgi:hypothetical protein